ncbi:MAG: BatA domain-containing protein [Cystobacterineae bacterium]|nr:BatA domain-containing protein [Cystobacterineae bacterium]
MSLLFSQPWMLLGLAAATLPFLVYLFFRLKPKPRPFGPMGLLLKSLQHTASLWKLRRLLIYALRSLLLAALALALARPWLDKTTTTPTTMQGEAATVLVLDASFSMRYALGKQTALEVAKNQALQAIEALSATEPLAVVLCDGTQTIPPPPLSQDKAFWKRLVQEALPSFLPARLNPCMETAAQLLEENPLEAKRLLIFSDFARHALLMSAPPPQIKNPKGEMQLPHVALYPVYAGKEPPQNRALLSMEVENTTEAGLFNFMATVQNFSPTPQKDLELQLRLKGQTLAKGFVDLDAHGSTRKTLSVRLPNNETGHEVEMRLAPDGLAEDDAQTLWLRPQKNAHILLVDGAPSADRQADEAYFVELALAQLAQTQVRVRDSQAAWRENLSAYGAVFLLNVEAPPAEAAAALKAFVEAGGGLWASLGDNTQLQAWNQAMGELLPRPLRWLKGSSEELPNTTSPFAKISHVQNLHPILQPFAGEGLESLLSARFFRHALMEAHTQNPQPMEVLLRLEDGAPLLVAHQLGKGHVLSFMSTADRDWNDLPLHTAFLPLIQRSAQWLSGNLLNTEVPTTTLGNSLRLAAPQNAYVGPHGEVVEPEAQGPEFVKLGPLNTPGLWWPQGRAEEAMPLLVKRLPQESDLALLDMEELNAWFGNSHIAQSHSTRQYPLWTALLLLALLAFCAEMLLLKP